MHKFKVLKDFVNPWGTPVQANPEGLVEGTFVTVEFSDADLADEKIKMDVDALIADAAIELVAPAEEEKKEDAPAEEKKDELADDTTAAAPAEEAAPVTSQKFYRNSLIVEEAPRTVGAQTFQHIKTVEGHDYDLTEEEYSKDVTVK